MNDCNICNAPDVSGRDRDECPEHGPARLRQKVVQESIIENTIPTVKYRVQKYRANDKLLEYINSQPGLLSLLYDLGAMPEQVCGGPDEVVMVAAALGYMHGNDNKV